MPASSEITSSFIAGAPPGELGDVVADIKSLTATSTIDPSLAPAFEAYNEEQFATAKLPGGSQEILVSKYNKSEDGRYFDVEAASSWEFDHVAQKASSVQSYSLDSQHSDLIKSLLKALQAHAREHYPNSVHGVYPTDSDSTIAILLVANKYSPNNFWNGRLQTTYLLDPSSGTITGTVTIDVHYYEDGNVRLKTKKPISLSVPSPSSSSSGVEIMHEIALLEKKYQEELNRAFMNLSEGAFKGLRRQLPVTRQKVEWERVGGYRLGGDLQGKR